MDERTLLDELGPLHRSRDRGLFDTIENMLRAATSKMDRKRFKESGNAWPLFTIGYTGVNAGAWDRTYYYNDNPFVEIDCRNQKMNFWTLSSQAPPEFRSVIDYGRRAGFEIKDRCGELENLYRGRS